MGLQYCDIVNIHKDCQLVLGRHLNISKKEADVANAVLYKHKHILYIIDTGAVESFGRALQGACDNLKPYDHVILINTHGHGDHVGNNHILESLPAAKKQHFLSTHDIDMMRDNLSFFEYDFKTIEPYLGGKSARAYLTDFIELFMPLNVDTPYFKALETQKLEDIQIGQIHWSGWNFNDDIYIMKSQGHSAGHVIVYFPRIQHLHMGDETNGYCNLFHDCDHLKSLESHTKALSMINSGHVSTISDGHTFALFEAEAAKSWLNGLIEGYYVFSNFIRDLFIRHPAGLSLEDIYNECTASTAIQALPAGANPNPTYAKLQILSKFKDLGIKGDCRDLSKAKFKFKCG